MVRVCCPMPRQYASESLPASVMKTPASPLSSTLFERSMIVCGGVSGIAERASAILVFAWAMGPSFLFSLDSAALRLGSGCAAALRAPFGAHLDNLLQRKGEGFIPLLRRQARRAR